MLYSCTHVTPQGIKGLNGPAVAGGVNFARGCSSTANHYATPTVKQSGKTHKAKGL